jgi:hypothetical protein
MSAFGRFFVALGFLTFGTAGSDGHINGAVYSGRTFSRRSASWAVSDWEPSVPKVPLSLLHLIAFSLSGAQLVMVTSTVV